MKSVTVIAKRWFQKSYGNTYHSVTVINDDTGEELRCDFEYGYGDQYAETAAQLIENAGWIPGRERNPNGARTPIWKWLRDNDVTLHNNVADVSRKRDL